MRTFAHGPLVMAYRTYGNGPIPVVAFHGFGRTGADFAFLEAYIGDRCTIHAFDLPFHGASPSPTERVDHPLGPDELAAFLGAFADHVNAPRVTVLGYSLGGRMALGLLERMPDRIAKAFLLAPDGLKHRPWYRGLAGSAYGRKVYAHFIDHPGPVHGLINGLRAVRVLSDRMHRFLIGQSDTRQKRELMRNIWLAFRTIEPRLDTVATCAEQHNIPIHLVFGRKDRVIRPAFGEALRRLAPTAVHVDLLDTGHVLLVPELGEWLRKQELG